MDIAERYAYPGQFEWEGIVYNFGHSPELLRKIKEDLQLDPADVVLATYPKSGTTWTEELIYSVEVGPEVAQRRTQAMDELFLHLEDAVLNDPINYDRFRGMRPPRKLKTHLQAVFFERHLAHPHNNCPKFITVIRNPKDTLVSFYHFHKMFENVAFEYTWEIFFELYKRQKLAYGDLIEYALAWWKYRDHPNVLILTYENMLADAKAEIRRIANFLQRPLPEDEFELIEEGASFGSMKSRGVPSYHTNKFMSEGKSPFFRKGQRGDWRNYFSAEQSNYIDERVAKLCQPLGLQFTY